MFEKYEGLIDLEEFLKKEYGYDKFDKKSMMKQPFISYEGSGSTAQFWITDKEGEQYLFKSSSDYKYATLYGELISKEVAKILGINCADVRACTFQGETGVLSKKITKQNETIINGGQVIQDVLNNYSLINEGKAYLEEESFLTDDTFKELYDIPENLKTLKESLMVKYIYNNLNNLDQLWSIIELYFKCHNRPAKERILVIDYLVKTFIFDVIMMQDDRHIENWGIIYNPDLNGLFPCPLYDNAGVLGLDHTDLNARIKRFNKEYESYINYPTEAHEENFANHLYDKNKRLLLTVSSSDIVNARRKTRKNNMKVLASFLDVTDSVYVDLLCDYVNKVANVDIIQMLKIVENENGLIIPDNVKDYITKVWSSNLKLIKKTMNSYGLEVKDDCKRNS